MSINPPMQVPCHSLCESVHHWQSPGPNGQHWHLHRGKLCVSNLNITHYPNPNLYIHLCNKKATRQNSPVVPFSLLELVCAGSRWGLWGSKKCVPSPGHVTGGPHRPSHPTHAQHHSGKCWTTVSPEPCQVRENIWVMLQLHSAQI